jgi:serine/threonine-protein kinase
MTDAAQRLSAALSDRYAIERELGAGGMATVYLAHDVRHDRKVALKVLRPELSAILGGERFLAEIKTTANLQHPHILSLFDSGEADGLVYYVMPYVEGESLRDRLSREKQLPVEEAVRIAREVASALDYAHRHSVVHRDIKPENVLLHEGQALVADFGIALAVSTAGGGTRLTETGMSLGTPHYMAPEQAMGEREITPKADVYALGCVLYEMLTGEPPFTGPTAQAIIARVMTEEPRSLTMQRRTIPHHVESAVRQALEKLPADRFQSAAQFAEALVRVPASAAGQAAVASEAVAAPRAARSPLLLSRLLRPARWAAVALLAASGVWGWIRPRPFEPSPVVRFTADLAEVGGVVDVGGSAIALSPDGSRLAFLAQTRDVPQVRIFLRGLDQLEATPLAGTELATQPFFSPDGLWIGFYKEGSLRKVSVSGGAVIPIAPVSNMSGATWGSDGSIVFAVGFGLLLRVSATGGTPDTLTLSDSSAALFWPEFLPGGKAVVAVAIGSGPSELRAVELNTGRVHLLGIAGSNPRWVDRGYLLYTSADGNLFAVRFDPRKLRVTGSPVSVAEGVRASVRGSAHIAHSRSGTVAYLGGGSGRRELVVVDRGGRVQSLTAPPNLYESPRFSPDGRRIAVGIGELLAGRSDIWTFDLVRTTLSRVTFDSTSVYPEWSADGQWLHYATRRSGNYDLWRSRADGSGVQESVYVAPEDHWEGVPTPDGRGVVFRVTSQQTRRDIWWLPTGSNSPVPVLKTPFEERSLAVSPDGRWLAYISNETGADEVYVRAIPGPGGRVQLSAGGGFEPRWGLRGREVLYRTRDSIIAIEVNTSGAEVTVGKRQALFPAAFQTGGAGNHAGWDAHPDGSRFVFVRDLGGAGTSQVNVLLHWFDQPRAAQVPRRD